MAYARHEEVGAVLDGLISQLPFSMTAAAEGLSLLRSDSSTGFKHVTLPPIGTDSKLRFQANPGNTAMAAAAAAGGEQGSPTTSTEDDGTDSPANMDTTCWEREGSGALL